MDDNTQAFPSGNPEQGGHEGMTLRDWFAGNAFKEMLRWEAAEGMDYEEIAEQAYMASDAMLRHRKKIGR